MREGDRAVISVGIVLMLVAWLAVVVWVWSGTGSTEEA
jgi:hypothetical protein